jgi:hypothetical protein
MNKNAVDKLSRRYPLSFAIRYVTAEPFGGRQGVGETVWMSGSELAFLSNGAANVGEKVSMYIEWPVLLQGEVPLQLIVTAHIVQRAGPLTVVRLSRHEFRTRRAQSSAVKPHLPFSTWETHAARQMPACKTIASIPYRPPAVASAAGG